MTHALLIRAYLGLKVAQLALLGRLQLGAGLLLVRRCVDNALLPRHAVLRLVQLRANLADFGVDVEPALPRKKKKV